MKKRVIIALILFIIWSILVITNNVSWFDNWVYDALISMKSDGLTTFMKIVTAASNVKVMIVLAGISLLTLIWKRKESLYMVGTLGLSTIINLILKNIIRRDRPLHLRLVEESGFSFPSGHAMGSSAFYGSIIVLIKHSKLDKKYKYLSYIFLSLLIFLIGISRIYLGVHYPSDIIGGWLIGFVLLNILDYLLDKDILKNILK